MSLTGALAPGSVVLGETRQSRRERTARASRDARRRTLRALAFAGLVICGVALAVLLVAPRVGAPQAADALTRPVEHLRAAVAGALPHASEPAAADVVVPARVTATSSCLAPDAHDTVLVEIAGSVRQFPLDACGSAVGRWVTVVAPGTGTAGTARVLGTGATAPAASTGSAPAGAASTGAAGTAGAAPAGPSRPSPMTGRLSVVLTIVAALGTGGLVVAVARDRRRRVTAPRRPASGRPARPRR